MGRKMSTRVSVCLLLAGTVVALSWAPTRTAIKRGYAPKPGVKNWTTFKEQTLESAEVHLREFRGEEFLVASANMPDWMLFFYNFSGPPEYVFDKGGSLVDWTADSGDDGDYQARWGCSTGYLRSITLVEAENWLRP